MISRISVAVAFPLVLVVLLGSQSPQSLAQETWNQLGPTATTVPCECGSSDCKRCSLRQHFSGKKGCRKCNQNGGCDSCPNCACEFCQLELDHTPIKKTCFKVEQKTICIPAIRFPWNKDCPPTISKTRKVCVLKKHSYECPNCSYKWTVVKPECDTQVQSALPQAATAIPTTEFLQSITRNQPPIVRKSKTVTR